jgi:Cu-Zn family superoxide dismutase
MSALIPMCGAASLAATLAFAQASQEQLRKESASSETASAAIVNARGATVGEAFLRETPNGVLLDVDLRNVEPGVHAFHVHEAGKCEAPDFKSAGGHWAPAGRKHGILNEQGPHAGDLPNVHVLGDGKLSFELFLKDARIAAGPHPMLDRDGAALVLHKGNDDYRTDPAGEAGDRIACGVIVRQSPM